ncbi:MAG: hypothetical protein WCF92_01895 [bacterium]
MLEGQLEFNLEKPTLDQITDEVFQTIINESKIKKIELEDVNEIIKKVLEKYKLDSKNDIDTKTLLDVIGIVIPQYKRKINESIYGKKTTDVKESPSRDWMRRHEEETGQWDV